MPILLIVLGRFLHQFEGVFIKRYNAKHEKGGFIFTAIVSLFSMVFFILTDIITDEKGITFDSSLIIYGVIGGICFCLASFLTYLALGCGSFVLSRLVLSYGILITVVHGLFLGESITVLGWIGIALIAFSLYLVKGNGDGENVKITKKWLVYITLSVVFAGVFGILQRQQQIVFAHAYDNEFMIISLFVSALCLFIGGIYKDGKDLKYILKNGALYAVGAGFSNGATNLLTLYVYTLVPMSFVAPTSAGVSIVISFLLSKLLFKEKFSKTQYLGVVLGGVALILFNL